LHLRGNVSTDVQRSLLDLAREHGAADRVFFHSQVSPIELMARSAEHDVGLALEQGFDLNRRICVANKVFFYMLAGLAIAATDVPGQRSVLEEPAAGAILYPPGDHLSLARQLQIWMQNPSLLLEAKARSLEAARLRWNWEIESHRLTDHITQLLRERAGEGSRWSAA
jgi:glycosyltransferase involved in cell wall biosynthesis